MQNKDQILTDALEKLFLNNVIPKEKTNETMIQINTLKKSLQQLSTQELELILKKIPENEIIKIKNQIT